MAIELPDGRRESNDVLEALRLRAVHARQLGYSVSDIAAILGVREETISRWCSRYDHGGREALPGDRTGRPIGSGRLLDGEQERGIQQAIETKSPQELEISSALWTRQAVRELIRKRPRTVRLLPEHVLDDAGIALTQQCIEIPELLIQLVVLGRPDRHLIG